MRGDVVIDATAGNGHDSLFLAQQVLPGGNVSIFDVQSEAIESTRRRLEQSGYKDGVLYLKQSHAELSTHIPASYHGQVKAIFFNFGYLPGGDKKITTRGDTSLLALEQSASLLQSGGWLSLLLYPGHEEGRLEAEAVEAWCIMQRETDLFSFEKHLASTEIPTAPFWIKMKKR